MKKLMTIGLLVTSFAFADEKPEVEAAPVVASYGYVNLGLGPFPIPLPLFGVGGRYQNGHHGFDGSLQFIYFGRNFAITKENFDYLHYFKPNLKSQFYVGGGLAVTEVWSSRGRVYLSPQVIVGKQYTNESGGVHYFQAQIDPVLFNLNKVYKHGIRVRTLPIVVLSYGLCF